MKTMKYMLLLLICLSVPAFAQGRKKYGETRAERNAKMEQVKSLKIAFITNELELTPEESAKFWPIYNAFEEKQRELRKRRVSVHLERGDKSDRNITEKETASLLAQMEENEAELFEARRKFISSLKGVIPAIKIIKLKKAEEDFNRKLLQQYRRNKKR